MLVARLTAERDPEVLREYVHHPAWPPAQGRARLVRDEVRHL